MIVRAPCRRSGSTSGDRRDLPLGAWLVTGFPAGGWWPDVGCRCRGVFVLGAWSFRHGRQDRRHPLAACPAARKRQAQVTRDPLPGGARTTTGRRPPLRADSLPAIKPGPGGTEQHEHRRRDGDRGDGRRRCSAQQRAEQPFLRCVDAAAVRLLRPAMGGSVRVLLLARITQRDAGVGCGRSGQPRPPASWRTDPQAAGFCSDIPGVRVRIRGLALMQVGEIDGI